MNTMKHVYFFLLLTMTSGNLIAQNKVKIQGEICGYKQHAVIYFMYTDQAKQQQLIDSVKIKDGKFEKTISISEPTQMGMVMSPVGRSINTFTVEEQQTAEAITFYVDKGDFNLKFDGAFVKWKMEPSKKIVTDFKTYNAIITTDKNVVRDSINIHYAKDGKINEDGTINLKVDEVGAYKQAVNTAEKTLLNNLLGFAKKNTDSYIGLLAMSSSFNAQPSLAPQLSEILNDYTSELQNTTLGKKLRIELEMSR